jgi:hypothetical protein
MTSPIHYIDLWSTDSSTIPTELFQKVDIHILNKDWRRKDGGGR